MKTTNVIVKFDAPRLAALNFYMSKKGASIEGELFKVIASLYDKHVPKDARELIEWQAEQEKIRTQKPLKKSAHSTEA